MHSPIVSQLDALARWRADLEREAGALGRFLAENELAGEHEAHSLAALRERLCADKLVVAFVAEFSRGKSELINAIFFADAGRRVLPATPGRTTMCPVELFHDPARPPRLRLLPIETRQRGLALAELRGRDDAWTSIPLDPADPGALAQALAEVMRTRLVDVDEAAALGFWSRERPDENPALEADGRVAVPAWRHALIDYPHPLLEQGLVVIDTPGLNAIGAEPELTLSLLPSAHAIVFVLAADTGVTRSDLEVWREHLSGPSVERFVVLNKIDTLVDPLASRAEVAAQIDRQRALTAQALELPVERVFPLSARDALVARVAGDEMTLEGSGLPALEDALAAELLPRRRELLLRSSIGVVAALRSAASRRLAERRRQHAEQLLELRGLRGRSGGKVRLMLQRLDDEAAEFERCTARLAALRAVQTRQLRGVLARLSSDALRAEVAAMQSALGARPFHLGARAAFATLFERLRAALDGAIAEAGELREMLDASFVQLNAEYGFAFAIGGGPALAEHADELRLIERSYSRYLSISQAWRLAVPGFMEQFRRMLVSKLRVVFESAAGEVEMWSRAASGQIDLQLRERRGNFKRRREAIERVQAAGSELEQRIAEVERQEQHLSELQSRLDRLADAVLEAARGEAVTASAPLPVELTLRRA
jgi:hypothetical protein